jgi:hypothetical protein
MSEMPQFPHLVNFSTYGTMGYPINVDVVGGAR